MTTPEKIVLKRELQQALGQVIRELREALAAKPSQEQMAEAIGMDRSYWGDLERGERSLTLLSLWRVARALEVSPSRLVLAVDRRYRQIHQGSQAARGTPVEEAVKRLRDFMDQSPTMKWLADARQNNLYCNRPLLDYIGKCPEEIVGTGWQALVHPDDLKKYIMQNKRAFARHEPFVSRYRMRRADGEYVFIIQHVFPQFTSRGKFFGMLGTLIPEPAPNHD